MRILPRFYLSRTRRLSRRWRQWRRHLTVARIALVIELIIFACALLFALTASRGALLDRLRQHTGLLMLTASFLFFGLLHLVATRRLIRLVERRLSPAEYDDRRILFDLGQEARSATSLDNLYDSIVQRIKDALETENVSIFVRDDETGDYVCRISTHGCEGEPGNRSNATASRLSIAREAFIITRLRNLMTPLVIEPEEFETWERAFESSSSAVREARQRESDVLRRIKSTLLLQIKIKDQLIGILSVGQRRTRHKYSAKDKEMLMSVAGELAFVIENARLIERMVSEEQLRRELQLAAEVQQGLLPSEPPASEHLELSGFCQPARGIGGDYYDFLQLEGEQLGVAIADVAGKGISAALVMANVQAALRSQTMVRSTSLHSPTALTDLVVSINRLLCRSTGASTYVTFFYAQFDERTQRLTYVNAGHNPPLLLCARDRVKKIRTEARRGVPSVAADYFHTANATGMTEEIVADALPLQDAPPKIKLVEDITTRGWLMLKTGGMVVGLFDPCLYEQETIQLQSGDILIAYTDGVTEALNTAGEEFGEHRLQDAIARNAHLRADDVRDFLVREVEDWCAGAPQHDDLTFFILKVK
jgi:sigma-B regulation protein RsbU (phosphoserine phosphatase)